MSIDIDKQLLEEAKAFGGHETNESAVHAALVEYVNARRQRREWASDEAFREDWDNPLDADYDKGE